MFLRLLLLMTLVPITELYLIVEVHSWLSESVDRQTAWLVTLGSILATGLLGSAMARNEGLRTLQAYQQSLRQQSFPGDVILDGLLILIGGALLLTPGYLTDTVGFSFLIPWTRAWHRGRLKSWLRRRIEQGKIQVWSQGTAGQSEFVSIHRTRSSPPTENDSDQPRGPRVIDVTPVDRDDDRRDRS